ncbi:AraC-type DNA-binding protein [Pedobacter caeni]|uniref:AraC-type DNA-binding protein n=2 Tax=Pedobacter caeni TaxID=288992 RepID=A0A1M5JWM1_9SPHI|nr:AraC-type DNA-binding protein [Pedobacter caeni]
MNRHTIMETAVCRISYHRIFLIQEGSGGIQIDEHSYPISGQELFLLSKGQLFTFLPGTTLTGYELSFGDCFWEKSPASASNCKSVLFNNAAANQHLPFPAGTQAGLINLFAILYAEYIAVDYINKLDALAAYLKVIMIKIANLNAALVQAYDSHDRQLYRHFIASVSEKYKDTHEVASFAKDLGISTRKLGDLCKRCGVMSPKEIINGQLIAEAKRNLQFSSKPVKDIAYELNFSSPDQFSHFFKKHTGSSPNDYRLHFVKIGM